MPKRLHDTEIWKQDWFLEMDAEYRTLWFYVKDNCDHAGIWKPEKKYIEFLTGKKIDLNKALEFINKDKTRIRVLKNGRWFIEDFISFQYGNHLNAKNHMHMSVINVLNANEINLLSIRGISDPTLGVSVPSTNGMPDPTLGAKDKDIYMDKDIDKDKVTEKDPTESNNKKDLSNTKTKFGEFQNVRLTEKQRQDLDDSYGKLKAAELIEQTSRYFEKKGNAGKYKNHYLCIRDWHPSENTKNKDHVDYKADNRKIAEEMAASTRKAKGIVDTEVIK